MSTQFAVEVVKPAKPLVVPKLKSGDDAAVAKELVSRYAEAQTGMRRIIALGLFAWEIKETQLKHGEWGPWLAANTPELSRNDAGTGRPKASAALTNYMSLTRGVLEKSGLPTINKYLATIAKFPRDGNLNHGQFLLIADKKVPDVIKPLRDKICALVDGKTQNQLFLEFKQADDDDEGARAKRGRLKGSSGLTKEQRERAAQRAEEQRIVELEEDTRETTGFLLENSDAKNFGAINEKILLKLDAAMETARGYIKQLLQSRKGQ
jgi:hypothetical protein